MNLNNNVKKEKSKESINEIPNEHIKSKHQIFYNKSGDGLKDIGIDMIDSKYHFTHDENDKATNSKKQPSFEIDLDSQTN